MGAQGRTTEIYKVGTDWRIVYVDTYLAEVKAVTAPTYDTAGHETNPGSMTLNTCGTTYTKTGNYSYAAGTMLLYTSHNGSASRTAADMDIVGVAPAVTITVSGVHSTGLNTYDGLIANGTTYLQSNTYAAKFAPTGFHDAIDNTMINGNYVLYLDNHGNIVGAVEQSAVTANAGIVVDSEFQRVGINKYVKEVELYLVNGTTATLNFVHISGKFFDNDSAPTPNLKKGKFIEFNTVTISGETGTYYKVNTSNLASNVTNVANGTGTTTANVLLTGVANTLTGSTTKDVDNNTVFIVANYMPDNSQTTPGYVLNTANPYTIYTGFKSVPTISSTTGTSVQYTTLTVNGVKYVLVTNGYVTAGKAPVPVDTSALFLSKAETYQNYATYNVVLNGAKTTVKIDITQTPALGHINTYGALNTASGAYSDVDQEATAAIAASSSVSYSAGVLTYGTTNYKTVADNCTVQVVNSTTDQVYNVTLDHIKQYSGKAMEFELDANGYISYLYIFD